MVRADLSVLSLDPLGVRQQQSGSFSSPGRAIREPTGSLGQDIELRLDFPAPQGCWEQNVGHRPQQVVHAGGREGGAENHDNPSGIDGLLPGLGLQDPVVGVEGLADHEEDHGHGRDAQHRHVPSRQQGGAGQDGGGVDARQAAVHEGNPAGEEAEAGEHGHDVAHAQNIVQQVRGSKEQRGSYPKGGEVRKVIQFSA